MQGFGSLASKSPEGAVGYAQGSSETHADCPNSMQPWIQLRTNGSLRTQLGMCCDEFCMVGNGWVRCARAMSWFC
eukprot:6464599-Amphidinium_carterae.1